MAKASTVTRATKAETGSRTHDDSQKKNKKPRGRSLEHFLPLNEAEERLLAACEAGQWSLPSDDPQEPSKKPEVRAAFIRFLVLGGDEQAVVHEKGVRLSGARISGQLDLDGCIAAAPILLSGCQFDEQIVLKDSSLKGCGLFDCTVNGIQGDRLQCDGSFHFKAGSLSNGELRFLEATIGGAFDLNGSKISVDEGDALSCDGMTVGGDILLGAGFNATGPTRLLGVDVGGDLNCIGGRFEGTTEPALSCERSVVGGSVFFRNGFHAAGEARLHGLRIGGNFDCAAARFDNPDGISLRADKMHIGRNAFLRNGCHSWGTFRLDGVTIEGTLDFEDGKFESTNDLAIYCQECRILGRIVFRNVECSGGVSLIGTTAAALCDDEQSWSAPILLHGFRFERIDDGPTDAVRRIAWLKKQQLVEAGKLFWPQPWEHLAYILRQMGYVEEGRLIAMEKQREMRRHNVIGSRKPVYVGAAPMMALDRARVRVINRFERFLHRLYGALAGYGYRPLRTFMLMTLFWLIAAGVFAAAEARGLFVPSAASLLTDSEFKACGPRAEGLIRWTRCPRLPRDYTTFDPLMYSLDVILPLVDLKQEGDWEPLVRRGPGWRMWNGLLVRGIMWAEILFGWIGSLLIVSALGRLVQKD
jgi:hypothetical protein